MWAMIAKLRRRSMGWRAGALERVTLPPFSPLVAEYGVDHARQRLAGGKAPHVFGDEPRQRASCHLGRVGAVGRDDAVGQVPERVAVGQGLGVSDVEGGAA